MSVTASVLFDTPQAEVASRIASRIAQSTSTSIITGFATPGGVDAIAAPIRADPGKLATFVVGSATYRGFLALDGLITAGVSPNRLFVHLGHTRPSGTHKHPTVRFHPMMHSKIYFMELPGGQAAAFIGSHNVTAFALAGQNAEAAVLLEGPSASLEFAQVRQHIAAIRFQSQQYSPTMKDALVWWTREFIDGLRVELGTGTPPDPISTVRTILIFAVAARTDKPVTGDHLYFEIPEGLEQIESLKTEVHLFLFDALPPDPQTALLQADQAWAKFTCTILGAENKRGNLELVAQWRIDGMRSPILRRVPGGVLRPTPASGMQQVRAEVTSPGVAALEYLFDRDKTEWEPEYADEHTLTPPPGIKSLVAQEEARGPRNQALRNPEQPWRLVRKLVPKQGAGREKDHAALELMKPESGSFLLVSLRRRKKDAPRRLKEDN